MTNKGQIKQNGQTQPISAKSLNDANTSNQIHFDGENTYYALSEYEFKTLKNGVDNHWKEICIASWSVFIPLCLNTIAEGKSLNWQSSTWNLFLNALFTIVTLILGIAFSIAWKKSKNPLKDVIKKVESKPKFSI